MKTGLVIALIVVVKVVSQAETWVLRPPLGLDVFMPVPETNPLTREKIAKGQRLFFDKKLSRDGTLACATCHDPRRSFTDGRAVPHGIDGAEGSRNTPALLNRGYGRTFFWDGRADSLEHQVLEPIFNPRELGLTPSLLQIRTGMMPQDVADALASFVRTIRSGDSPFDRYATGKSHALNEQEEAGLAIFRGKGNCTACHVGPNFTDEEFHNTGIAWRNGQFIDEGRFTVSHEEQDHGAFKTPTLRNVAQTAPYMHDGSIATLDDVIDFYSKGGHSNPNLDTRIRPRNFTSQEKGTLKAFLKSLNGRPQIGL